MKRTILLCCASIFILVCYSQEPKGSETKPSSDSIESNYLVRDVEVEPIKESKRLLIHWKLATEIIPDFFAIERSNNNGPFEVIAILKSSSLISGYDWTDDSPLKGKNEYRIRCAGREGGSLFSKSVSAQVSGQVTFKFYPNPADNILIIRSEIPVDIHIVDATGKIRISNRIQGLQTINVSSLEKGVYLIRMTNKLTNAITQEKLIKN